MDMLIIIMGLLVGFLVGLTGVGGAALLTPLLVFMGVNPSIAVGTDLVYNSITKFFGSIQHIRQKTVNMKIVKYFALGSIPGAILSVLLIGFIDGQEEIIKQAMGYMLIVISLITVYKIFSTNNINKIQEKSIKDKKIVVISIGFILGAIVGLTSIGSGSLFALAIIYLFNISSKEIVGTDIVHAFFLVTAAGVMHASFGNVDYILTLNLLLGSIPGVIIGSKLSTKVSSKALRLIVAIIIFASGIKLI